MKMINLVLAGLAVLVAVPSFADENKIVSEIHDRTGASIGTVTVIPEKKGVRIDVSVSGLKPGMHGIHIHNVGKCEGPDFKAAGSHFAYAGQSHGMDNPKGPHLGDMPNLNVKADGKGKLRYHTDLVTLGGGENSLKKAGGTALVIHEKQDDQKTDPSGNSGDRVACAVLAQ